jgi:hypothetical protein
MAENSISYGMGLSDQQLNTMLNSDVPEIVAQAQDYINQAQTQQEEKPSILQKIADFFNIGKAGASEPDKITLPNYGTGFNTVLDSSGGLRYVPIEQPKGIMVPASETNQLDLVNQINQSQRNIGVPMTLEETMGGSIVPPDPRRFQSIFPTTGIMQQAPLQNLGIDTSYGVANEEDVEQVDSLTGEKEESGIMKLIKSLIPGSNLGNFLPKQDPRATGIRNFYSPEGLTSTGSIASGIMKGYNPVSGGFLNMITGGKFGQPTNYGLSRAMQKRIENIVGRKTPQTDISRSRVAELRNLQRAEMEDRSNRGESLGSIGRSTFSGPGMAFERKSGGVSGKGTANERNYGGR